MNKVITTNRTRAFMLIEMVVAIAIISIIATLVTINFTESRRSARDGNRKTDISTILSAVTQYSTTNGTTWIRTPDKSCTAGAAGATNPDHEYTGDNCVGANGRSYGKVNLYDATSSTDGLGNTARNYPAKYSIIDALKMGGYFNTDPKDPFNKDGKTNDSSVKDYVLIRACPNGQQHIATGGQLVAVWTYLERNRTATETEATVKVPGSVSAIPENSRNATATGWGDHYDFAAGEEYTQYADRGYAVSNGVANWNLSSATCQPKSPVAYVSNLEK